MTRNQMVTISTGILKGKQGVFLEWAETRANKLKTAKIRIRTDKGWETHIIAENNFTKN